MNRSCMDLGGLLDSIPHKVMFASILLALSPVSILLNLTLIISLVAAKQVTQNISSLLIFIMTLCDFVSGAVGMPLAGSILLDLTQNDVCIELRILIIVGGFVTYSTILAALTAIDRYLHMNPNIRRDRSLVKHIFEKPTIYYLLVLVFICSISYPAIIAFHMIRNQTLDTVIGFISTGFLVIYIVVTTCLYTRGYLRIRKFTDNNLIYGEAVGQNGRKPDYVRRLYKTVLALVLLACFHVLPLCLLKGSMVLAYFFKISVDTNILPYFFEISLLLFYTNCITNCLVIFHFNKTARHWIKKKIGIKRTNILSI